MSGDSRVPLVTVECATYNHAAFIRDALEGFLRQETDFRFEVLVHDDASTDGTQEVIREYHERRPDLIVPVLQRENQWSKGVDTWKTFLRPLAKGTYLALCEGDDYWTDPLKLQKQVDILERNPRTGIVHTGFATNGDLDTVFTPWAQGFRKAGACEARLVELLCGNFISTPSTMVRMAAFDQAVADSESYPHDDLIDLWYWMRISWDWDISFLPDVTAFYRVHGSGLSRNAAFMNRAYMRIQNFHLRHGLRRATIASSPEDRLVLLRDRFREQLTASELGLVERVQAAIALLRTMPPRHIAALVARATRPRRNDRALTCL